MTELSESLSAGAVPKSPAVPTLIMVVGLALSLRNRSGSKAVA